jgi:hypothetical protein
MRLSVAVFDDGDGDGADTHGLAMTDSWAGYWGLHRAWLCLSEGTGLASGHGLAMPDRWDLSWGHEMSFLLIEGWMRGS